MADISKSYCLNHPDTPAVARCATCGNSDVCDYLVVGCKNPIAAEYQTVPDGQGFLVSKKRLPENAGGDDRGGK